MAIAAPAVAEDWAPDGPLTIQIGFGAGGSTDTMGRNLGQVMKENTGWNVVVKNKPGCGGVAMFTGLSQMPANGRTIGMGVSIPVLVQLVQRGDQSGSRGHAPDDDGWSCCCANPVREIMRNPVAPPAHWRGNLLSEVGG